MTPSSKVKPTGKKEIISRGRFLHFVAHEYFDRFGALKRWESVERAGNSNIVMLFPVTKEKEVVLVKQYRFPVEREVIELPAGILDRPGESLIDTAQRELREETGYRAGALQHFLTGVFDSGVVGDIANVFFAADCVKVGEPQPEASEQIEVITVPLSLIIDFVTNPPDGIPVDIKIPAIYAILKEKKIL